MPPISLLKWLWPRRVEALNDAFAHPAEDMIPPDFKKCLEGHHWRNLRYPPYQEGFPGLVPGEWFMHRYQKELIDRIEGSIGLPEVEFQSYVLPILNNFAKVAHLLPASQNHHHAGPGGLLRHSLEVAALCLDVCLTTAFDTVEIAQNL
ncbi:integrating conjugative element relaxase, PFGI-1 class [compost metagenome]